MYLRFWYPLILLGSFGVFKSVADDSVWEARSGRFAVKNKNLQIKTDSRWNYNRQRVAVEMYSAGDKYVGKLEFWKDQNGAEIYAIHGQGCSGTQTAMVDVPNDPTKIWTLHKSPKCLKLYCNDIQVIEVVFSKSKCKENEWNVDIDKVNVDVWESRLVVDSANKYTGCGQQTNCENVPDTWTNTELVGGPAPSGTSVIVRCKAGFASTTHATGQILVTCKQDEQYLPLGSSLVCDQAINPDCTKLPDDWNNVELKAGTGFPIRSGDTVTLVCTDGFSSVSPTVVQQAVACVGSGADVYNPNVLSLACIKDVARCDALPDDWNNISPKTPLPVNTGIQVEIQCDAGYQQYGDDMIECVTGQMFVYNIQPTCVMVVVIIKWV